MLMRHPETMPLGLTITSITWKVISASVFYNGALDEYETQTGHGILVTEDFMVQGEWKNGYVNGKGNFMHLDGTVYTGFWVDD